MGKPGPHVVSSTLELTTKGATQSWQWHTRLLDLASTEPLLDELLAIAERYLDPLPF